MGLGGLLALMLLVGCVWGMEQFGNEVGVTFGSVVRLISPHSGFMYLSLNLAFTHTTSSSEEAALCQ